MNWFIPAFVSRSPDSGGGIRLEEGTRRWPRSSKKRRNVSRIRRPSMVRLVYRRVLRELAPALLHRAPALGDRLRDALSELEQPTTRLPGDRARRHLLHLLAREASGEDRPGRPDAAADREPEDPPHLFSLPVPLNFDTALDRPAPNEITLTSGLEAACSTRPDTFSTRFTISEADSSMPSTRSSSRLVLTTELRTSVSSGTVSSRTPSISSLVLSSMRKVFSSTTHRNRTSKPQKAARTISATSPELVARTAEVGMSGLLAGSGFPCGHHTEGRRPRDSSLGLSLVLLGLHVWGFRGLLPLARRFVVPLPFEPNRAVLLLDHVSGVVVRVLVALAVPQLAERRMAGLLQVERHRVGRRRVLLRPAEGRDHAVGLRGAGEVDGGLGEVQARFRETDVLDRLCGGDGHEQRSRVGQA